MLKELWGSVWMGRDGSGVVVLKSDTIGALL
jgi:hypothetical protein